MAGFIGTAIEFYEWGGAALLAVEHVPSGRRGRYAAYPQLGPSVGFFAVTGVFLLLSTAVSDETFRGWAWRVPFLLSLILVAVGLFVRIRISETPVFQKVLADRQASRSPFADVVRRCPRELLLGSGAMIVAYGLFYTATTYCLSYGTKTLGVGRTTMLLASMGAVVFLAAGTWFAATRSDRLGRRRTALTGTIGAAVWGPLLFPLLDTGRLPLIIVGLGGALLIMGVIYGPMGGVPAGAVPGGAAVLRRRSRLQPGRGGGRRGRSAGGDPPAVRVRLGVGRVVRRLHGPRVVRLSAGSAGNPRTRAGGRLSPAPRQQSTAEPTAGR
ncbi:MFS transporter [Streptomyces sp. NY05-11A]|uniref:MFS transporter n=1 Tax=Streptomyces soliscabiei TaxID=588897 RepID=UPI0029B821C2|nr:MFS transporter [Streptomyces sp. NY05-11A]MDX2680666.1 MFS transporter [Streptomyces sp. NY05-11A]